MSCNGPLVGANAPPNVVIILADDMGWGDLAANGSNKIVKTPNLDAMAANGVRFTRIYSASPLCSPTRAALMSGRHPTRYGCFVPKDILPAEETTIAEALRGAGYATGHFGKWHIGGMGAKDATSPGGQGFDTWFSIYNSYQTPKIDTNGFTRNGQRVGKVSGYCEDVIMDEAIKFVRAGVEAKKPFLAVICPMAPHSPFEATERLRAIYPKEPEEQQHYWGMISSIDENVGKLRKTLRELKVADDTLLVFTSDNGGTKISRRHQPFAGGKGNLQEGTRVPGIVGWPARIKKAFVSDVPVFTCDLFPTVLAAANVLRPRDEAALDGIDLLPLFDGAMKARPSPLVLHFDDHGKPGGKKGEIGKVGFAVHDGKWKLLTDRAVKDVQLYDVVADPGEKNDLATREKETVARLQAMRAVWWKTVSAEPRFVAPDKFTKK